MVQIIVIDEEFNDLKPYENDAWVGKHHAPDLTLFKLSEQGQSLDSGAASGSTDYTKLRRTGHREVGSFGGLR